MMMPLQKNIGRVELFLKERFEKQMIVALAPKFKSFEQK
jgi:hypothetical protein